MFVAEKGAITQLIAFELRPRHHTAKACCEVK